MKQKIKHIERQLKNLFNFDSTELFGDKTNEIVAMVYIIMAMNALGEKGKDLPIITLDEIRESMDNFQLPIKTMVKMQSSMQKQGYLNVEQQDELIEYITKEYQGEK